MSKYNKLNIIVIMKVLSFLKDDSCFNTFNFMKNNPRSSRLITHLNLVIQMFAQKFYSPTFFFNNQDIKKFEGCWCLSCIWCLDIVLLYQWISFMLSQHVGRPWIAFLVHFHWTNDASFSGFVVICEFDLLCFFKMSFDLLDCCWGQATHFQCGRVHTCIK